MKTRNFKSRLMLVIAFLSVSFITSVFGQAPEKMSYQAIVRDNSNQLLVNKQIGIFIVIQKNVEGATIPSTVYQEKHTVTSNANGLITLAIGAGTTSFPYNSTSFSNIKWDDGNFYIKTIIDPAGGTNYTLSSESQLLSVPYALYAKTAGNTTDTTATLTIGQVYQGGIIFWLDTSGQHGLLAATEDQSTGISWFNQNYSTTNAVRDGIRAGMYNTERIITSQGSGSFAAQLCANYQGGGYGDWYLPSKEELNLMYINRSAINTTATANGGSAFATAFYRSSTEYNNLNAWNQNFVNGSQLYDDKSSAHHVRAVRSF